MKKTNYLYAPDLSDERVKRLFREFLIDKMRSQSITTKALADNLYIDIRTVRRYVGKNPEELPSSIPEDKYKRFLEAVNSSNEEFRLFASEKLSHKVETQPSNAIEIPQLSKASLSDIQPPMALQRFPRFFDYLPLWAIPLALLITFFMWQNQSNDYELGVIAKEKKQHANAIDFFKRAIEKDSKHAEAYYELADIYAELTDNDSAVEYYRKGIEKDTQFSRHAYNNLALLLLDQNDIENTLLLLDRAQQQIVTPIEQERWAQSGIIFKNQAWAYWKAELYTEAMKHIIQAQEQLGPAQMLDEFPEVFCLHALITKHIGDPTTAEQLCISRFEAYQAKQQNGEFGNTIKPIHGMTYELYLLVRKQRNDA